MCSRVIVAKNEYVCMEEFFDFILSYYLGMGIFNVRVTWKSSFLFMFLVFGFKIYLI